MLQRIGQYGLFLVAGGMVLATLVSVVRADVPVEPRPRSPQRGPAVERRAAELSHPLAIRIDPKQSTSRIIIPRAYLAAAASPAAVGPSWNVRRRSIIAGFGLSIVIACGFLMLVFFRRRRLSWATFATTAAVGSVLLIMGTAAADLLPPGRQPPPRPAGPPSATSRSEIVIQSTARGNEVVLILGRDAARRLEAAD